MSDCLIDTNVLIDQLPLPPGRHAVSVLSMAELISGLQRPGLAPVEQRRRQQIHDAVERSFAPLIVSASVLEHYREVDRAVWAAQRNPRPRRIDLLLAATARAHGLALLTRNVDDYAHLQHLLPVLPA